MRSPPCAWTSPPRAHPPRWPLWSRASTSPGSRGRPGGSTLADRAWRGKSVRKELQRVLADRAVWDRVLIGYYNGGEIGRLADDAVPAPCGDIDHSLRPLADLIRGHGRLSQLVKCEVRPKQVTLELA